MKAAQVLLLCLVLQATLSVLAVIKVDTTSQHFVDEYGRVRLFHGVNAVYKLPPWHPNPNGFDPQNSLSPQDVSDLYSWGFNAVRLGTMWPGVEPAKGKYNTSYVDVIETIVDNLAAKEIYTILDFHQDVFNRRFCGEGVPDWAVEVGSFKLPFPFPALGFTTYPLDANGYPSLTDCLKVNFATYYFSEQCSAAFQSLYDNTNGTQNRLANFWNLVSNVFKGHQHVLGYELINEPWAGDIYLDPKLLEPGHADLKNLQPMYEKLNKVIRNNDNDHIVFYEKAVTNFWGPAGFTQAPGGPSYNDRQALSYHIYCGPDNANGSPTNVVACDLEDGLFYEVSMRDVRNMGGGGFLTEFGAMDNETNSIDSINFLTGYADSYLQSWAYWQFKLFKDITTQGDGESFYNSKGQLEFNKVKALSRTYAQATAGMPLRQSFNPETSAFQFTYAINAKISQPTEIYLNEAWYYPKGYTVTLSPSNAATWKATSTNHIAITTVSGTPDKTVLNVSINPK